MLRAEQEKDAHNASRGGLHHECVGRNPRPIQETGQDLMRKPRLSLRSSSTLSLVHKPQVAQGGLVLFWGVEIAQRLKGRVHIVKLFRENEARWSCIAQ